MDLSQKDLVVMEEALTYALGEAQTEAEEEAFSALRSRIREVIASPIAQDDDGADLEDEDMRYGTLPHR